VGFSSNQLPYELIGVAILAEIQQFPGFQLVLLGKNFMLKMPNLARFDWVFPRAFSDIEGWAGRGNAQNNRGYRNAPDELFF
jgi:hypothetical protein